MRGLPPLASERGMSGSPHRSWDELGVVMTVGGDRRPLAGPRRWRAVGGREYGTVPLTRQSIGPSRAAKGPGGGQPPAWRNSCSIAARWEGLVTDWAATRRAMRASS